MENLKCNFKDCFKELEDKAWVTFCSHIFCNEHGKRIASDWRNVGCLACNTKLEADHQIIKTKLDHSKAMKSLLLCGNSPKSVMEIANSALSFWSYQKNFENKYLQKQVEHYRKKLKSYRTSLEDNEIKVESLENTIEKLTKEKHELKVELAALKENNFGRKQSNQKRKHSSQSDFLF